MSKDDIPEEAQAYNYPNGHVNHLSVDQLKALNEFKAICQQEGYYTPSSEDSKASHGDETLLRFLRARTFVPEAAFQQFKATEEWRTAQDIENWYNTIGVDEYEETRLLYTHWTGRRDKAGMPFFVFDMTKLDAQKLSQSDVPSNGTEGRGSISPKLRRLFATYEHLTNFVMPLCSAIPSRPFTETPISQTTCIVDISGMGIRQFWKLKNHLQDASALATAHYPETLGRTFIVGAPSFFPTVWNWIKHWYDPVTVSKIFVLSSSEVSKTLAENIELCDIPKKYGGTLDWEFGQLPTLDPEILKIMMLNNGATTIPKGPIRWRANKVEGVIEAHALGSQSGAVRDEVVAKVTREDVSQTLATLLY